MAMGRNAITTAIVLFLIVADVCNASSFLKLRYLADEAPTKNDTAAAPLPSSLLSSPLLGSGTKKSNLKPDSPAKLDSNLLNKTDSVPPPPDVEKVPKLSDKPEKVVPPPQKEIDSGNSSSLASNSKNDKTMDDNREKKRNIDSRKNPNSTDTEKGAETNKDKNDKKKKKKTQRDESDSESGIVETCVGNSCEDGNSMTACVEGFRTGSKELVVLVHNSGEKTLKVNFAGPAGDSFPKVLKVPKHRTERINISLTVRKRSELVLSAGDGDCVLPLYPPVSEGSFFFNLPSYNKLVTPINAAYFSIVAVVIFGGSWACCMFRKRRQHDGIPYQELEMGLPESMAATEVETAEGWDQGWDDDWDDDWDEEKAVKSPVRRPVANISANGLTARSSNRDGWENDWDE